MTKYISEGEQTNLPCRRIPNNLYRYSIIRELKHSSLLLKCGSFFQRAQYVKEEVGQTQVTKVSINRNKSCG